MSEIYRALADPTRRKILQLLREREMSAGEIASHFDLAKPTLSGHFAVLRECGRVLSGPSPADLFPAVPRRMMLVALAAELRWARECGSASYQVLNACRAWRYSEERVFCSKLDGARWARTRVGDVSAIDAAIRHRQGGRKSSPMRRARASCSHTRSSR